MTTLDKIRPGLLLCTALLSVLLIAGCSDDATPPDTSTGDDVAEVGALPSSSPSEPEEQGQPADTTPVTLLPAESDAVVVQIAKIEHNPWEAAILSQMSPHFSLQASGRAVYQHPTGPSELGWYEAELSEAETLSFVQMLADDVGIIEQAQSRPEPELVFKSMDDGSPLGTEAAYVVYLRTAEGEGRLVLTEDQLLNPEGPGAEGTQRLALVLKALDLWKDGVDREYTSDEQEAIRRELGWWTETWQPFEPDSAVALASKARSSTPDEAPYAEWPLEVPLDDSITARFGSPPNELIIEGEDVVAMLEAEREREPSILGPLWRSGGNGDAYLVGVRTVPPGVNHVVVDYEYYLPMPMMGLR